MPEYVGRGAQSRPANRYEAIHFESEEGTVHPSDEPASVRLSTEYYPDATRTIVSTNHSPDLPFRYSVNPYRGCAHGCSYCYARPTHEYLGFDAGLDFESKILVKQDAPRLLRKWLARKNWVPEPIVFSGVTDCYQPAESHFGLTRRCLEVCWECRQPITIVTKNALVTRDIDLLRMMAEHRLVRVSISLTSLDQRLTRIMEPRTSSPQSRLDALTRLCSAGIPTHAMVAPVIPGLNDHEIPAILKAVAQNGAQTASYVLLRLPLTVRPVFLEWLRSKLPLRATAVENRIKQSHNGKWNDAQFGQRMRGTGLIAEQIQSMFQVFARKYRLVSTSSTLNVADFRHPPSDDGQLRLF